MAKTLTISGAKNGKNYLLEYTRKTAAQMESSGFDINKLPDQPNIMIPMLFSGAFLANHRDTKQSTKDEIFAKLSHKDELVMVLAEMYNDTAMTLLSDPEEGEEGNPTWKVGM